MGTINAKAEKNEEDSQGPRVRMYDKRDQTVNNEAHVFRKMVTCTIKEMSCESNSLEPSPKS